MRPVLELREYEDVLLPDPSGSDLNVLTDPALKRFFTFRRTQRGWLFKAMAVSGVLTLDCAELRITPKIGISGEMLLHWLHYATKPRSVTIEQRRRWDVEGTYFTDMVIQAFLDECRILLRHQLRKDYIRNDDVGGVLRGRLDVVKQASRRYGMLDRLHVHTFDRKVEIWENEVCGAALRYAATHAENRTLRREAAALAKQFPSCPPDIARTTLKRARHHRMNVHYVAAHTWAGLLLQSGGVADLLIQHELPGESRLLDMYRLWEAVVHRMVGSTTIPPIHVRRPSGTANFLPDAIARLDTGLLAVDAKYKDYDDRMVGREDVHQLLTYASAYRTTDPPKAAIVHPSEDETAREQIIVDFRGRVLGVIDVIGVNINIHPEENSLHLKTLLSS